MEYLTALAYAIARGVAQAWFDEIKQRSTVTDEQHAPKDDDLIAAARARLAGLPRLGPK